MSRFKVYLSTFLILATICTLRSCHKADLNREKSAKNATSKIVVEPVDFYEYKERIEQENHSK